MYSQPYICVSLNQQVYAMVFKFQRNEIYNVANHFFVILHLKEHSHLNLHT
jgi:hypothetical protein